MVRQYINPKSNPGVYPGEENTVSIGFVSANIEKSSYVARGSISRHCSAYRKGKRIARFGPDNGQPALMGHMSWELMKPKPVDVVVVSNPSILDAV